MVGSLPKLEQVLRGIRRSQVACGRQQRQRIPMSVEALEVLRVRLSSLLLRLTEVGGTSIRFGGGS